MENRKVRVGITHGDTNGTGYELILKAFEDPAMLELCTPIVYGSPKVAAYHRKALGLETQFSIISQAEEAKDNRLNLLTVFDEEVKVDLGLPTPESAESARKARERAKVDLGSQQIDALVLAPDTTPAVSGGLNVLVGDNLRVALLTNNMLLKDVPESVTKAVLVEKCKLFHATLKRDFNLSNPRIAILALNPQGADGEQQGEEEVQVIAPAIEELEKQGIQAFGPYAADSLFGSDNYLYFDGVMALYYDQGVAPFRAIEPEGSVRLVAGMPQVLVAPMDGCGFDIAGKNTADACSMRHAVYLAIDVCRHRLNYDEPLKNPLQKYYHEKRDESEKVRFAIPKSKDSAAHRTAATAQPLPADPKE